MEEVDVAFGVEGWMRFANDMKSSRSPADRNFYFEAAGCRKLSAWATNLKPEFPQKHADTPFYTA